MNEENNAEIETLKLNLIEIQELIYVLKMSLDNIEQPMRDTTPYAALAKVIEEKISAIINAA